ncbi:MAG: penicillin-binding protein 2 [Vicinamibacterales bacterium]
MTTVPGETKERVAMRLTAIQIAVALVFGALAVGFWYFQVVEHARFEELAENNHQRRLALRAPRGVLYDRHGRVLVENRESFSISILREHSRDLDHTMTLLARVLGLDLARVRETVERHRREPAYQPIVIVDDASLAQVAAVTARRLDFELPDVVVERVPARRYPTESLAAHLFGYVGEATEVQAGVRSGAIVGQSGIEKTYNRDLMGTDGAKLVVVNSMGREMRTLDEVPPVGGKRLQLTIDFDVQQAVEDAFKASGFNGAAVFLDPRTGEVLAFASVPGYDPNAFASGIDRSTWSALNGDRFKPLQNRAIQGRYSPGSVFKMAVALAALEENVVTPDHTVYCAGGANFFGRVFKCHKKGGHGAMDMRHAIKESCDVYFYTVGNMLGVDRIHKWATLLGLGVKSGIDLPNEVQGLVPSTEWKREKLKEKWYAGETISVSIGQGQVSVTPVSLAVYMATLANGGTRVTPHVVRAVDDGSGWRQVPPPPPQSVVAIDPVKLQAIRDGMWMVVSGGGTGRRARIEGKDVSGKTGTAQVISNEGRLAARATDRDLHDHGWFSFFAPRDNPEIAGVVFLEHGYHSANAAEVAHHALETYFAKKEGRPLPPPPTTEEMNLDLSDPMDRRKPVGPRALAPAAAQQARRTVPAPAPASVSVPTPAESISALAN